MSSSPEALRRRLYIHATLITVDARRHVILDGALLVAGCHIAAIGKSSELLSAHKGVEVVDCNGKIIIPGLINTHAHLAQSLLRGLAEDLPLHSWLCDAIWPLEANYAGEDGYVAAMLTIAEMLRTGTTCFLEAMLTHRSGIENVVRAVKETGVRACLGKLIKAAESNPALNMADARDRDVSAMTVTAALSAHNAYHGSCDGRLEIWLAAGTPRGSPLSAHAAIGAAAKAHGIGMTMHCAEAPADLKIFQDEYHCSPLQFCREAQLTSARTVLAHVVHPDPTEDYAIMRDSGVTVSHNPTSNCKLGSGIAPIPDMLKAGVNVALGTDGAPCNNTYDMFREMHLAAIIHSGARQDAGAVSAYDTLEMATINGAKALGRERDIGSLEVGKLADFVVVSPPRLGSAPFDASQVGAPGGIDPVTVIVHSCTGADVEKVIVNGVTIVEQGSLISVDESLLVERAKQAIHGIRERSGVRAGIKNRLIYV